MNLFSRVRFSLVRCAPSDIDFVNRSKTSKRSIFLQSEVLNTEELLLLKVSLSVSSFSYFLSTASELNRYIPVALKAALIIIFLKAVVQADWNSRKKSLFIIAESP